MNLKRKQYEKIESIATNKNSKIADDNDDSVDDNADLLAEAESLRKDIQAQNRKARKSGGFQSMGLSHATLRGILRKGYAFPTPIQRKCIPVLLNGRDVIATARTGSGKTAAFLIPLFEKLQHSVSGMMGGAGGCAGPRALILSPTRELCEQTAAFIRDLGRFFRPPLKLALLLGGTDLRANFEALTTGSGGGGGGDCATGRPDILVATPGRLLHLMVEMGSANFSLSSVEYVVFDEADRLFELDFGTALYELLARLPPHSAARQSILISATLPDCVSAFARAGLVDPVLIRLDTDVRISPALSLHPMLCRPLYKWAAVCMLINELCVLRNQQCAVFLASHHHIEALLALLRVVFNVDCSTTTTTTNTHAKSGEIASSSPPPLRVGYAYSTMDREARNAFTTQFRSGGIRVLLVTDIAARGIDFPLLDHVINACVPDRAKLFVHRVGRVARAGRSGAAWSLVESSELAWHLDQMLFVGREFSMATHTPPPPLPAPPKQLKLEQQKQEEEKEWGRRGWLSRIASFAVLDVWQAKVERAKRESDEVSAAIACADRAQQKFERTRTKPSRQSTARAIELLREGGGELEDRLALHPAFATSSAGSGTSSSFSNAQSAAQIKEDWLRRLHSVKIKSPSFASSAAAASSSPLFVATQKKNELAGKEQEERETQNAEDDDDDFTTMAGQLQIKPSKKLKQELRQRRREGASNSVGEVLPEKPSFYAPISKERLFAEEQDDAMNADVLLDEDGGVYGRKRQRSVAQQWDRYKKKFVNQEEAEASKKLRKNGANEKMIRTENGQMVSASYKSGAFERWLKQNNQMMAAPLHAPSHAEVVGDDDARGGGKARQNVKGKAGKRGGGVEVCGVRRGGGARHQKQQRYNGQSGRGVGDEGEEKFKRNRQLKNPDQILKEKKRLLRLNAFQKKCRLANKRSRNR